MSKQADVVKLQPEKQFPKTFDGYDKFNRKEFADKLTKTIKTFYPFYDDAFVLSLNAKFGSGKTTFLEMWKHDLEREKHNMEVIYINAWKSDFDDEPIVPIISSILKHITSNSTLSEEMKGKNRKLVKGLVARARLYGE